MLGIERRQAILELIKKNRKVYVSELSKSFNVTEETIRRDLEKLEDENLVQRSYGGAVLKEHLSEDVSFGNRASINRVEKARIAKRAADLIHDGDTIMLDSSTTCMAFLKELDKAGRKDITIITNSIRLLSDFCGSESFNFISTGGSLRKRSCALTGPVAISTVQRYFADYTVISCRGLVIENGILESNEEEGTIKEHMLSQGKQKILLADNSKFNKTAFVKSSDLRSISTIVTDSNPSSEWIDFFAQNDIELIVCD